ncbi:S-layer family protein [Thioclava sp. SK-1]|uniref:beta strand repeat-containing protein n=1 Tax=Thioclava sp. SK-1 TaxID=1889770 RepID=UPI000824A67A|nr:Ig-like domain-containing protein [Thioclava sp. SK-1]
MADFDKDDFTLIGSVNTLTGTGTDDTIEIYGSINPSAGTTSLIDGGNGTDTLILQSANTQGTTFTAIEATQILYDATIDAAQIENLGQITLHPSNYQNSDGVGYAYLYLSNGNGQTADFSNLSLGNGSTSEYLYVAVNGLSADDTLSVDFSDTTLLNDSYISFNGGNADEAVQGSDGDDSVDGNNGDDSLDGGVGNDTLIGANGDDTLIGGAGNDSIQTGYGVDSVLGGTGNDTIETYYSDDGSSIDAGDGDDLIDLQSNFQYGTVAGGNGTDTLILQSANTQGTTFTAIEATQILYNATIDAAQIENLGQITLHPSNYQNSDGVGYAYLYLSNGNGQTADFSNLSLGNGSTSEYLYVAVNSLSADDTLSVDFSDTTLLNDSYISFNGGNADEAVQGSDGNDSIDGNNGDDTLIGGAGNDSLIGGSGVNVLRGEDGDDYLNGLGSSADAVVLDGGSGNDTLEARYLRDGTIDGGADDDLLILRYNAILTGTTLLGIETTEIEGHATLDAAQVVDLGAASFMPTSGATLYLQNANGQLADFSGFTLGQDQALNVSVRSVQSGDVQTLDFSGIAADATASVTFTASSNAAATVIAGAVAGDYSGNGYSTDVQPDTISYENSIDAVNIDLASQTVSGGDAANDLIAGFENAIGSQGNDVFTGSEDDNLFDGKDGEDIVNFTGDYADYTVQTLAGVTTVTDNNTGDGDDGTDTVSNIEILRFADQDINIGGPTTLIDISGSPSMAEGDTDTTAFTFTVTRSGITTGTSSVMWAVAGTTADADDFGGTLPSGTVSFAADETEKTITVAVSGDTVKEADETFTVTLSNPTGAALAVDSAMGTIENDDNAPPVGVDDTFTVDASSYSYLDVLANDTDEENDTLSVINITQPSLGSVSVPGGLEPRFNSYDSSFVALSAGEVSTQSFSYTLSDGTATDTATVTVNVIGQNEAPTLSVDRQYATEDGPAISFDLADYADDVDGDDDAASLTYALTSTPSGGSVTLSGSVVTFDPGTDYQRNGLNYTTHVPIGVTVTDSHGAQTYQTIRVQMNGVNDAPVITSTTIASVAEGTTGVMDVTYSDVDANDTHSFSITGGADAAAFTIDAVTGALSFATAPVFADQGDSDGDNVYLVEVGVSDGTVTTTQMIDVMVTGVTKVSIAADSVSAVEGGAGDSHDVSFTISRAGAIDQAVTLGLTATGTAQSGSDYSGTLPSSVTIPAGSNAVTLTLTVTGDDLIEGDESVGLTLSSSSLDDHVIDTAAASASHLIVNDDSNTAPVAVNDSYQMLEDTVMTVDTIDGLLANDTDPQGDALSVTQLGTPEHGSIIFDADGSFIYMPDTDFYGTDTIDYTISDGTATSTAQLEITVHGLPEHLNGTTGMDVLTGADDDEIINGMGGPIDILTGGGGADVFVFSQIDGARDMLRIMDYDAAEGDMLDLNGTSVASHTEFSGYTYLFMDTAEADIIVLNDVDYLDLQFTDTLIA